jgi:hypothetical protein
MNDAHAYEMQVQMWKANTWGVTHATSAKTTIETTLDYFKVGGIYFVLKIKVSASTREILMFPMFFLEKMTEIPT